MSGANLQFIVPPGSGQILHGHDLHYQTGPACEMLGALPLTRVGIILLPRVSCALPLAEDVIDHVLTEGRIQLPGLGLVRTGRCPNILFHQALDRSFVYRQPMMF